MSILHVVGAGDPYYSSSFAFQMSNLRTRHATDTREMARTGPQAAAAATPLLELNRACYHSAEACITRASEVAFWSYDGRLGSWSCDGVGFWD